MVVKLHCLRNKDQPKKSAHVQYSHRFLLLQNIFQPRLVENMDVKSRNWKARIRKLDAKHNQFFEETPGSVYCIAERPTLEDSSFLRLFRGLAQRKLRA